MNLSLFYFVHKTRNDMKYRNVAERVTVTEWCQISREYQRPGSCNTNIDLTGWVRMASCNDGIRCCYGGKCCKRYSNRQVDTCSYPSYIGHYQGIPYVVCLSTVTHKERPIDHICEVCHGNNGSLMSSVQVCGVHDLRVV